jgi:predicted transglutaminase-like cysteine proteinase
VLSGLSLIAAGVRAVNEGTRGGQASEGGAPAFANGAGMKASLRNVRTLDDRIKIIKGLIRQGQADPSVRAWVSEVLTRRCGDSWCVPEKDRSAEIRAIFDAIRERVRYTGDVWSMDTYQAARHVLKHRTADCDDYTILGSACLLAVGIPVTLVVIQTTSADDWDHIYLRAGDGQGGLMGFDASVDQPAGWEAPPAIVRRTRTFPL